MSSKDQDEARLAKLPAALRARLLKRIQARQAGQALQPVARDAALPLSFAQERLWFLDRLTPGSAAYHIPAALRVTGELDLDALRASLSDLVARHEILRSGLVEVAGQRRQEIHSAVDVPIASTRVKSLEQARQLTEAFVREPFDLSTPPLLRARVLKLAEDDAVLVFVMHHVVSDGWSMAILVREWGELYAARREGRPPSLSTLPVQYADFAVWQRASLETGDTLTKQIAHWKEALDGAPARLDLPLDHPRRSVKGDRGRTLTLHLPADVMAGALEFARETRATPFMVLLSAWKLLLAHVSGATDLVVGTPVAGRRESALEGLIGCFVNTLPVRTDLTETRTFREALNLVRTSTLAAFEHQDVPFERLVHALEVERDPSTTPVFQVMFAYQSGGLDDPEAEIRFGDLTLAPWGGGETGTKFDLSLSVSPTGRGTLTYDEELFDRESVVALGERWERLLRLLLEAPDTPWRDVDVTGPEERARTRRWNQTTTDFGPPELLYSGLDRTARDTPEAIAVVEDETGRSWTYGALVRWTNGVAHALRSRGVSLEDRVGVCLPRSAALVAAVYGVIRAGAAYVPLEPELPPARLAEMARDARCRVVITTRGGATAFDAVDGCDSLVVERCAPRDAPPPSYAEPQNAAYVIYTSGSTGRPKGATNTHAAVWNRLAWHQARFSLQRGEAVLFKTPFSFDVSVWELFWAHRHGGTLVVARPEGHKDPAYLDDVMVRRSVAVVHFVPSMLGATLEWSDRPRASPRAVICSGEALSRAHVQRFFSAYPKAELHNLYGPTEAAVDVSAWRCESSNAGVVPIGAPVANVRLHVMDRVLRPRPAGLLGELAIAGDQVGRGYLARPRRTAERFVPDPVGPAGARLYRTGDVARWRRDGQLLYEGRLDFQVKLRGLRIELGEVEAALEALPRVTQAVAGVRDQRLVAWVTPSPTDDGEGIQKALGGRLPGYMVPASVIGVEHFELTRSGKVDRRALPSPVPLPSGDGEAPATPAERAVAELFEELLGVEDVGRDDDFFRLGGHSLLATRLVSRIRALMSVEVSVGEVFAEPTPRALAVRVQSSASRALPPLEPVTRVGSLRASYAQERLWFLEQLAGGRGAYHMAADLLARGPLDLECFGAALDMVVRRHEVLRTRFVEGEPGLLQEVMPEMPVPVDVVAVPDLQAARERSASHAQLPFALDEGPLLRVAVFQIEPDLHLIAFVMHHVVSDGWSLRVLVRDWSELYAAALEGRPARLPVLPVQYADYAAWQRRWLEDGETDRQLAYWRAQLEGAPPVLELPLDHARPATKGDRGGRVAVAVPPALMARVGGLAEELRATPFMVLLAAWKVVLASYAGSDEVVVGTPVAGRRALESEQLIGFFVNALVLRTKLGDDPSFRAFVDRVREGAVAAYAHQDVPFEKLVSELSPSRDPSVTPLFQVAFAYQTAGDGALGLQVGDLTLEPLPDAEAEAKYDLSLSLLPTGEGTLVFDRDLFERTTAERLSRHWQSVLRQGVEAPDRRVSALELMTADERAEVTGWSGAVELELSDPRTVPERILDIASQQPSSVAVVDEAGPMTYASLVARAAGLAAELKARGLAPEDRVALILSPGAHYVASALGVMLAGGAYVSLDPAHPAERLAYMVSNSSARCVVFDEETSALRSALGGDVEVLSAPTAAADVDVEVAPPRPTDRSLAYVIYTSGTTGRPKGVAVEHRGLRNLCDWHVAEYTVSSDDRATQIAGLGFDACVWEIWPYLTVGARVHVVPPSLRRDVAGLVAYLREHAITVSFLSTPLLEEAIRTEDLLGLSVRAVLTGGDRLHRHDFSRLGVRVMNHYGPTENTVVSTRTAADASEEPPIGQPLPNTTAHVVDGRGRVCPIGVPGELWVGGRQVARGYLGRGAETARTFVPDPWSDIPGARVYRTGDRVSWLPSGELRFHGRIDQQVKLNGQRVELGEIESVLGSVEGVTQAVVVLRTSSAGASRLIAYLVAHEPAVARAEGVARRELPSHMVPSAYVAMAALPLTPSGKVDRRALPAPEPGGDEQEPEGELEQRLAAIWNALLGTSRVGRADDFFSLGGHSLLATRLVSRVRDELGVELSLESVFAHPRLSEMAAAVSVAGSSTLPRIEPAPAGEEPPLSYAQQRLWFLQHLRPESAALNIPARLDVRGPLDADRLARAFERVVADHRVLRTLIERRDGRPSLRTLAPEATQGHVVEHVAAESWTEHERTEWRRTFALRSFDLSRDLPVRVALMRLADEHHELVLSLHHVAADGWSASLLGRYAGEAYRGGLDAPPSPPALQYVDYASWQRRHLEPLFKGQLEYWRSQLAGIEPTSLPTDAPRPAVQSHRGAQVRRTLSSEDRAAIVSFARERGVTPFAVVLGAFKCVLAREAGVEDVVVGAPVTGRRVADVEPMLGCFLNTVVLRTSLAQNPSFGDVVERVSEVNLAALENQDIPFERLLEELNPPRDVSRTPWFQVFFNYLENLPGIDLDLGAADVDLLALDEEQAKFDVSLYVAPAPDGGLSLRAVYCADLFDETTVSGWLDATKRVLRRGVSEPAAHVLELTAAPVEQSSPTAPSRPGLVSELFEDAARTWPERTAIRSQGGTVTYAELQQRMLRVAGALDELPDGRIGLLFHKGIGMVATVMAALRAGRSYVALDATYPEARLQKMVERAGLVAIACDADTRDAGVKLTSGNVTLLDVTRSDAAPLVSVRHPAPDAEAYVLFTSGSTGEPKGVRQSQENLAHFVDVYRSKLGLGPEDRVSFLSSFSFDAAIPDVFGALTAGATLCPYDLRTRGVAHLADFLETEGVTIYHSTPTIYRELLRSSGPAVRTSKVRAVVLGGERVMPSDLSGLRDGFGNEARLINLYGSSEATISVWAEYAASDHARGAVPIGWPVQRTAARLVDSRGGDSWVGDLIVESEHVALGYLDESRGASGAFGRSPSGRTYRTGDVAHLRADGTLVCRGRTDRQVKVRGNRIELGEVEAAARALPGLGRAVALVLHPEAGDAGSDSVLALFVEASSERRETIREQLRKVLPPFMVPNQIVVMDELPLTLSGKVDSHRLARLRADHEGAPYRAPETPLQKAIAAALAHAIAGASDVGLDDHFFDDLGGNSLALVRAASHLSSAVGQDVPSIAFFEYPTVVSLAQALTRDAAAPEKDDLAGRRDRRRRAMKRRRKKKD